MNIWFSILLFAAVIIHCTVGNEGNIKLTDITCTEPGIFPYLGSCDEYYECREWKGGYYSVRGNCAPGSLFDDVFAECKPMAYVTSPARCLINAPDDIVPPLGIATLYGSLPGPLGVLGGDVHEEEIPYNQKTVQDQRVFVNATLQDEMFAVTAGGNETADVSDTEKVVTSENISICDHIDIVNTYTTLVTSTPSLTESFGYLEKYNKTVMKYNRHLENAQNNAFTWRNGESILNRIKKTYSVASAYERLFSRAYEYCENNNARVLPNLKYDISKLEEEISASEDYMRRIIGRVPQLRKNLENEIEFKHQEIARKQQQIKANTYVGLQLTELLDFLYYVKHVANKVENLAKHSKERLKMFHENLDDDYVAFERFAAMVGEDIRVLTEEEEQYRDFIKVNEAQQVRLENKKDTLDADIDGYNKDINKNRQAIRKTTNKMYRKINILNHKRDEYCKFLYLDENVNEIKKARTCNDILRAHNIILDLRKERKTIKTLTKNNEKIRKQILDILDGFAVMDQEMRDLLSAVPTYGSRLQQIIVELGSLQMYYSDLESLQHGITSSMDSIINIMREFQDLQSSFESITKKLNGLIVQGIAAENIDDKRQAKLSIEEHISDVQGQLQELLLPELEECI